MTTEAKAIPPPLIPVAPGGYPAWMPPILVKELRQGMRSHAFVATFVLFQVVIAVLLVTEVIVSATAVNSLQRARTVASFDTGFWALLSVFLLVAMPLRAMTGLRTEIETRTLDMLVLTRLTAWRIVVGKWASLMAQSSLVLLTMLPYGMIRYFAGGANLATDAGRALVIFACSGLLTAAGLWASGYSRALALPITIAMVVIPGFGGVGVARMAGMGGGPPVSAAGIAWPSLYAGFLLLLLSLVGAVRRIAPAAENYSPFARLLGLLAWIPVPIAEAMRLGPGARELPLVFALGFSVIVALIELSGRETPMKAHGRFFGRGGIVGRVAAFFLLPGWQSALLYTTFIWLLGNLAVQSTSAFRGNVRDDLTIMITLAFGGLVFPAVIASFWRGKKHPSAPYIVVFLVMGLLAIGAGLLYDVTNDPGYVEAAGLLPGTGFWLTFDKIRKNLIGAQSAVIAATVVLGLIRSRSYFRRVFEITRRHPTGSIG